MSDKPSSSASSTSVPSPPPNHDKPYYHIGIDTIPPNLPPPTLPDPNAPGTPEAYVHPTAIVDNGAIIGKGTRVWHFAHVCKEAHIGVFCNLGQNVYVGPGATIGNYCKIQNNVSIYDGIHIADQVFLGPSCVFTNDKTPRAVNYGNKWFLSDTYISKGVTIGANATVVCGHSIGEYATIGAGSTVTHDVLPYALMVGAPAKQLGWVSRAGFKLDLPVTSSSTIYGTCPVSGEKYRLLQRTLTLVEDEKQEEKKE